MELAGPNPKRVGRGGYSVGDMRFGAASQQSLSGEARDRRGWVPAGARRSARRKAPAWGSGAGAEHPSGWEMSRDGRSQPQVRAHPALLRGQGGTTSALLPSELLLSTVNPGAQLYPSWLYLCRPTARTWRCAAGLAPRSPWLSIKQIRGGRGGGGRKARGTGDSSRPAPPPRHRWWGALPGRLSSSRQGCFDQTVLFYEIPAISHGELICTRQKKKKDCFREFLISAFLFSSLVDIICIFVYICSSRAICNPAQCTMSWHDMT